QGNVQGFRLDGGVGGDDHQHGGQAGGEHAGTLGHAANAVADAVAVRGGGPGRFLGDGVGGHDRGGRGSPAVERQGSGGCLNTRQDLVHGQLLADQAGGADSHVGGGDAELVGHLLCRGVGVLEALGAGAGVGSAGVQDDGVHAAVAENLAGPVDGRGGHAVAGENCRGSLGRAVVDDEGHVRLAG